MNSWQAVITAVRDWWAQSPLATPPIPFPGWLLALALPFALALVSKRATLVVAAAIPTALSALAYIDEDSPSLLASYGLYLCALLLPVFGLSDARKTAKIGHRNRHVTAGPRSPPRNCGAAAAPGAKIQTVNTDRPYQHTN
jgi:hypothetical protein